MRGWVGPTAGLNMVVKREIMPMQGVTDRTSKL